MVNNSIQRTLCVQEVADGHGMVATLDLGGLEDLLKVSGGVDAHVLLAEGLCLLVEVGVLLRAR
jgi:hypothetical protein